MKHNPKVTSQYQKDKQSRLRGEFHVSKYHERIVQERYEERMKQRDLTKDRSSDKQSLSHHPSKLGGKDNG